MHGHGRSNNALCSNIALALIFHHGQIDSVPEAQRHRTTIQRYDRPAAGNADEPDRIAMRKWLKWTPLRLTDCAPDCIVR